MILPKGITRCFKGKAASLLEAPAPSKVAREPFSELLLNAFQMLYELQLKKLFQLRLNDSGTMTLRHARLGSLIF